VSRRAEIVLSDAELRALLDEQRTLICATIGRDGWPHLMPLWYVVRDGECWSWTYAKSQKVRNLERDPRCTIQVETGEQYNELRGVMFKAECEILRELETVAGIGAELAVRYGGVSLGDDVRAAMRKQAAKRVGLRFLVRETASWDHRKLGGGY
jgi:PPOX class probable F420-dependent enzyme